MARPKSEPTEAVTVRLPVWVVDWWKAEYPDTWRTEMRDSLVSSPEGEGWKNGVPPPARPAHRPTAAPSPKAEAEKLLEKVRPKKSSEGHGGRGWHPTTGEPL